MPRFFIQHCALFPITHEVNEECRSCCLIYKWPNLNYHVVEGCTFPVTQYQEVIGRNSYPDSIFMRFLSSNPPERGSRPKRERDGRRIDSRDMVVSCIHRSMQCVNKSMSCGVAEAQKDSVNNLEARHQGATAFLSLWEHFRDAEDPILHDQQSY